MSTLQEKKINLIVALGEKTRAIGKNNNLLWQIKEDIKRFKELTLNHPVVMGRKTWESIPEKFRPLKNRENIVVTRNSDYKALGALVAHTLSDALERAKNSVGSEEIFIIGGAQIYQESFPLAQVLHVTIVSSDEKGDVFFPEYEKLFPNILFSEKHENADLSWRYETRTRK